MSRQKPGRCWTAHCRQKIHGVLLPPSRCLQQVRTPWATKGNSFNHRSQICTCPELASLLFEADTSQLYWQDGFCGASAGSEDGTRQNSNQTGVDCRAQERQRLKYPASTESATDHLQKFHRPSTPPPPGNHRRCIRRAKLLPQAMLRVARRRQRCLPSGERGRTVVAPPNLSFQLWGANGSSVIQNVEP